MSMVFQEPMTALNPTMRIGDQVAEVMTLHKTRSDDEARERVVELLEQVGISKPHQLVKAYPHQLSGGQRQRVVLAIAMANDPALLICDEPTTALDVTVQATVLDLIVEGVEERDAALLFITHDLAVVASVCERVLVMYGGRIVEAGPVEQILTSPQHRYTVGLLAASDLSGVTPASGRRSSRGALATIPGTVPGAGRFPAGCVFRNRCAAADEDCKTTPAWTSRGTHPAGEGAFGFACHHPAEPVPVDQPTETRTSTTSTAPPDKSASPQPEEDTTSSNSVIEVVGVNRDFRRPRARLFTAPPVVHAVRDVSLTIDRGERFGIVGESGSGKSTLLRLIAGLDQPTAGEILIDGRQIQGKRTAQLGWLREKLQLVFQDPMSSLDPRMRVRDIIAEPLVAQGWQGDRRARVADLLERVGLSAAAADRYPHQFSGGQRQRISVARALAPGPEILLADEPVSALDVSVRAQVLNLIDEVVDGFDLTLLFVSHDLSVVRHVCDRVAVMRNGEVVEVAPTEELFAEPKHPYTQSLLAAIPNLHTAIHAVRNGRT
jgi:oligopeptide/dipeptide ABC transporter ATP-binding protein